MRIRLDKFIGDETGFAIEHRILNIVIIFSFILAVWSAVTNYLLKLDPLLVWNCVMAAGIMVGLYYLSFVKKRYSVSVLILIISVFFITPAAWILNGGISGSIPFYIILFSSMSATMLFGLHRMVVIVYFLVVSTLLLLLEYHYPFIISAYSGLEERYIDIFIGLITTIVFNSVIIVVIMNYYNKEHQKAALYLKEKQQAQERLLYLSYHDALTGLYNRMYYEKEIAAADRGAKTDIGVFVIDVDRLKFINDIFGHEQGDFILARAAKILRASFRSQDIIARIGGDEYVVIVKQVTIDDMQMIYQRIQVNLQKENGDLSESVIPVNMSIGYAYSARHDKSVRELFREADKKMYRNKLQRKAGAEENNMVLVRRMAVLKQHRNGGHSKEWEKLLFEFALTAGVPEVDLQDISLFAEFHDIGEIGVPDRILKKAGFLTKEEKEQLQQHCEIGYRIAQAVPELVPVADWILKHHEWWNGKGYPLGLAGEDIPLICRIAAIADTYDAMTTGRPYHKAVSLQEALQEIKRCAGTQFDPKLVEIFIAFMEKSSALAEEMMAK